MKDIDVQSKDVTQKAENRANIPVLFIACFIIFSGMTIFLFISYFCNKGLFTPNGWLEGWGSFVGGVLSFIGTVSLGVLALWQNKKLHNEIIQKEIREELRKDETWKRSVVAELKKLIICKDSVQTDIQDKRFPFDINALRNTAFINEEYALKILVKNADKYLNLISGLRNIETDIKNYSFLDKEIKSANISLHSIVKNNIEGFDIAKIKDQISSNKQKMKEIYSNIVKGSEMFYDDKLIKELLDLIDVELIYH